MNHTTNELSKMLLSLTCENLLGSYKIMKIGAAEFKINAPEQVHKVGKNTIFAIGNDVTIVNSAGVVLYKNQFDNLTYQMLDGNLVIRCKSQGTVLLYTDPIKEIVHKKVTWAGCFDFGRDHTFVVLRYPFLQLYSLGIKLDSVCVGNFDNPVIVQTDNSITLFQNGRSLLIDVFKQKLEHYVCRIENPPLIPHGSVRLTHYEFGLLFVVGDKVFTKTFRRQIFRHLPNAFKRTVIGSLWALRILPHELILLILEYLFEICIAEHLYDPPI